MNEEIIGFDALYDSMKKCVKGVRWKDSVAHYHLNAIEETIKLEDELHNGTYRPGKARRFTIYAPKKRDILSVTFKDRVYQRSLNDNAVYPQMSKSFIRDNFACQTGKGTDKCRDRLEAFLHKYYIKYGNTGFVLYFDVSGYYPNMQHSVAEGSFSRKLDAETLWRVLSVLQSQYGGGVGYDAGSQLIQIAGISVLDRVDHYVKEYLRCKMYARYMDDMPFISNDLEFLKQCKTDVTAMLSEMGFKVNPTKTRIGKIEDGIPFLGYIFVLTDTGKVLRFLNPKKVKEERKKLVRMFKLVESGKITLNDVDNHYKGWRNSIYKRNGYRLQQRMDAYYYKLRRNTYEHLRKSDRFADASKDGTAGSGYD